MREFKIELCGAIEGEEQNKCIWIVLTLGKHETGQMPATCVDYGIDINFETRASSSFRLQMLSQGALQLFSYHLGFRIENVHMIQCIELII